MEHTQVLELMGTLKLYGMRGAYDELMATGINARTSRRGSSVICCRLRSPSAPTLWEVPQGRRRFADLP